MKTLEEVVREHYWELLVDAGARYEKSFEDDYSQEAFDWLCDMVNFDSGWYEEWFHDQPEKEGH